MHPSRFPVILAPLALASAWLSCPSPAAPVGVPATLLPDPAQLFSEPFDLGPDNPTVELEFVPMKAGKHSAVAVWDGEHEVQMRVGEGKTYSGRQGVVSVFAGKDGDPVAVRLSLSAGDRATVTGMLTILYGVEDAASNRPFKPTLPGRLLPPVTDLDSRDALLPIFIHLTERYLGAAPDSNELDLVFAAAVERNPGLTRPYLRAMVKQYRAIPEDVRAERLVEPTEGKALLTPLSRRDGLRALMEAGPRIAEALENVSKGIAEGAIVAPARLEHIEPAAVPTGYEAGQEIVLEGFGLASGVEEAVVELWPEDLAASRPAQTVTPTATSHRRLSFALPKGLTPGHWRVDVVCRERASNQVVLTVGEGKAAADPAALTGLRHVVEGDRHLLQVKGLGLQAQPNAMLRLTFTSPERSVTLNVEPEFVDWETIQAQIEADCIRDCTMVDVDMAFEGAIRHFEGRIYPADTPLYRVQFLEVECQDESNPENGSGWWPYADDEVVTSWVYAVDGAFYSKNTGIYSGFNDGDVQVYAYGDMFVVPMGGWFEDWQPIADNLLLSTTLYEWNGGDVHAAQGVLDVVCNIINYVVTGTLLNAIISEVFDYLKDHVGEWFGNWGDPDLLGQCTEYWTADDLANLFAEGAATGKTGGVAPLGPDDWVEGINPDDLLPFERLKDYVNHYRQLDFDNSDHTGSYAIRYRISHRLEGPPIAPE